MTKTELCKMAHVIYNDKESIIEHVPYTRVNVYNSPEHNAGVLVEEKCPFALYWHDNLWVFGLVSDSTAQAVNFISAVKRAKIVMLYRYYGMSTNDYNDYNMCDWSNVIQACLSK